VWYKVSLCSVHVRSTQDPYRKVTPREDNIMTLCLLILLSLALRSLDLVLTNSAALYKVDIIYMYKCWFMSKITKKNVRFRNVSNIFFWRENKPQSAVRQTTVREFYFMREWPLVPFLQI
jgi:hypothetical protein